MNNSNDTLADTKKKAPLRFRKGEVRIPCEEYPDEYIVKVCIADPANPKLMSLESIMNDPDFVKSHRNSIISIEQYLSDIVDSFESMRDNKQAKLDSMPKNIKDFYDNYYRIRDTFKDCVDAEKSQVTGIFKETIENIVDCFVDAGNTLKDSLSDELTNFEENTSHLRTMIDENYKISGIPSESEVLKNVNEKKGEEI